MAYLRRPEHVENSDLTVGGRREEYVAMERRKIERVDSESVTRVNSRCNKERIKAIVLKQRNEYVQPTVRDVV